MSYQSITLAMDIFTWGSLVHEHGVYLIAISSFQFGSFTILCIYHAKHDIKSINIYMNQMTQEKSLLLTRQKQVKLDDIII